jgi:hypothetical protein
MSLAGFAGEQAAFPDLRLSLEACRPMDALVLLRPAPERTGQDEAAKRDRCDDAEQANIDDLKRAMRVRCPCGLLPFDPAPWSVDVPEQGSAYRWMIADAVGDELGRCGAQGGSAGDQAGTGEKEGTPPGSNTLSVAQRRRCP